MGTYPLGGADREAVGNSWRSLTLLDRRQIAPRSEFSKNERAHGSR
jgi:hypothetical protein